MPRLTNSPKTVFHRLVEYLGAEVEAYGEVVEIHDFGNGRGYDAELGPLRCTGRQRWWDGIGHLLFVATTLEEFGGMGCTWEGLHEAAGFAFDRKCTRGGNHPTRPADQPCPLCGDEGGELQLPLHMGGTADAMMSRLAEPEFYDHMMDSIVDAMDEAAA